MTRRSFIHLLAVVVVMMLTIGVVSNADASSRSRKADRILKKHVRARGGMSVIMKIRSMRVIGHMEARGIDVPFTLFLKRPNLSRMDMEIVGQSIIQAYDGRVAWWVNPLLGLTEPTEMPDEAAASLMRWTDFDGPLVNHKKKRHKAEYIGKEELDTGVAYKIRMTLAGGEAWYVFIDEDTYLEVMRVHTQIFQGDTMTVKTYFSDFSEVAGTVSPKTIRGRGMDGTPYTMYFDSFYPHAEINADMFAMP